MNRRHQKLFAWLDKLGANLIWETSFHQAEPLTIQAYTCKGKMFMVACSVSGWEIFLPCDGLVIDATLKQAEDALCA